MVSRADASRAKASGSFGARGWRMEWILGVIDVRNVFDNKIRNDSIVVVYLILIILNL